MALEKKFECDLIGRNGVRHITLYEISESEKKGKHLIGKAGGTDLGHCVYLGLKYEKIFRERARYYHICRNWDADFDYLKRKNKDVMLVEFYGDK